MDSKCIFCEPNKDLILLDWSDCLLLANYFPLGNKTSFLVVPKKHVVSITDLPISESTNVMLLVKIAAGRVKNYFKTEGMNIFINDGIIAGQTVPHLHVHIVAREVNDGLENFKRIREKIPIRNDQLTVAKSLFTNY
jgi:histidine triad (HIT) family protein